MKLKTIAGIVLVMSILLYTGILVLGNEFTPFITGFIFFNVILLLSLFMIWVNAKTLPNLRFMIFEAFFISLCLSVMIGGVKLFDSTEFDFETVQSQIDSLEKENTYFEDYTEYVTNLTRSYEISNDNLTSAILENKQKLATLAEEQATQNTVLKQPIAVNTNVDTIYEYKDEGDDDD